LESALYLPILLTRNTNHKEMAVKNTYNVDEDNVMIFRVNPTPPPMPTPPASTDEEDDDTPPPPPPPVPDNVINPFEREEEKPDPSPEGGEGGEDGEDGEPIDTDDIDESDLGRGGEKDREDIEEIERKRADDDEDDDSGSGEGKDDGLTDEQREFQKEIQEKRERLTLRKRTETTIRAIDQLISSGKANQSEISSLEGQKKSFIDILNQIED